MSRRDSLSAVERRIRRIAVRYGLNLLKPQKPDPQVLRHGGYMLRDEETAKIVFGDKEYRFSASIDEIEAYLERLGAEE
ncbi:hypothetical protein [Zavarzinia compransoris]|uniref:Uncharacterized protein n=1 Tax=Zavarzinia compransoris TaxID=1264899 RepID=A0A317EA29_9PROT|nr:hypothetical protein [Zavarzinia compransoris]PWR23977.1 hypothetical protein DKG75_05380 [Zavarzinia compransoris]TDP48231.1 hypothetical protein DES42_102534 [Zavarzinia compransoris]